jgi:L-rhamnose mutarotase
MSTKKFCCSCDLKDDSKLIEEYKSYHEKVKHGQK